MNPQSLPLQVERAVEALEDYKANDITVLDVRNLNAATDFFLIASGSSDLHVRSMGGRIADDLERDDITPHHVEGLTAGKWVLLDYVDFVIHIFHPSVREYYGLERLWSDAPMVEMSSRA
jgi:ribosome-associated protein